MCGEQSNIVSWINLGFLITGLSETSPLHQTNLEIGEDDVFMVIISIYLLITNSQNMNFKTNLNQIVFDEKNNIYNIYTGKSFSEVLILASTNPKYDKRLSIELPV